MSSTIGHSDGMGPILSTMDTTIRDTLARMPKEAQEHLANLADNLQLIADLGYGDVVLAVPSDGTLLLVADAHPATAVTVAPQVQIGQGLDADEEAEAYEVLAGKGLMTGERRRATRGITYSTTAYPVGPKSAPYAVLIRHVSHQVAEAPGKMERTFIEIADDLIDILRGRALTDVTGQPFVTTRRAGDGLIRFGADGTVRYASPNAMNIMRSAGIEGAVVGRSSTALPGGATAIAPVLRSGGCLGSEVHAAGRVLDYRVMALSEGAAVLVEDVTEARRREQEIKVKEATIREVHHRVKNNLQTVASLLRIQARRTDNEEVSRALREAVERITSMAVVHEMLASTTDEKVDFTQATRTVVDMVRQSVADPESSIEVSVEGDSGDVPASAATSLALVVAELVHNAIEHGLEGHEEGTVTVAIRRFPDELHIVVRDDGNGLPADFSMTHSSNLGLAIVRTVVQDDLGGTLAFGGRRGATVMIRVPMDDDGEA